MYLTSASMDLSVMFMTLEVTAGTSVSLEPWKSQIGRSLSFSESPVMAAWYSLTPGNFVRLPSLS